LRTLARRLLCRGSSRLAANSTHARWLRKYRGTYLDVGDKVKNRHDSQKTERWEGELEMLDIIIYTSAPELLFVGGGVKIVGRLFEFRSLQNSPATAAYRCRCQTLSLLCRHYFVGVKIVGRFDPQNSPATAVYQGWKCGRVRSGFPRPSQEGVLHRGSR